MVARILQSSSTKPPGSGKHMPINPDDNPSDYFFAIMALGGKTYSYLEAIMSLSGSVMDFDAPGKSQIEGDRKCKDLYASSTSNKKLDEECRGNLNEKCAKRMDGACKGAGLYERLVHKPLPEATLPVMWDNTYPTYSLDNCFAWLEPLIIKNTLSFSFKLFKELQMSIDRSFKNFNGSLRLLQNTAQIIVDPVSKNDIAALIPSSIAKMESNTIDIDRATAVSAISVDTFIKTFNELTTSIVLKESYLSISIYSILILIGLLFWFSVEDCYFTFGNINLDSEISEIWYILSYRTF